MSGTDTSSGAATTVSPSTTTAASSGSIDDTTDEPTEGTTMGVQPDTSTSTTSGASSSSTSTGEDPGTTSTDDGTSSSGGLPAPTCDELYGSAAGYILCMETALACQFLATTGGESCNTMCSMFGGTCIAAFDNDNGTCQLIKPNFDTCDTNRLDEICECSK